jgi:hypothetical protein
MRISKCFPTNGSKVKHKPFGGFAAIDISLGISWKFRVAMIASTSTVEALATDETLGIVEKIDSEQNFAIFSDSESVPNVCFTKHCTVKSSGGVEV